MPRFPNLEIEPTVQVNDRTRLDASKSFATQDLGDVTKVEIDPGTGTYINVTPATPSDSSLWYLDYVWADAGTKTLRCQITTATGGVAATSISKTIEVVTEAADKLFASDNDLVGHESDILKWVKPGRNTFKDIHRAAQTSILAYLDRQGYTDDLGNKLTKAAIVDLSEVRQWSTMLALKMIFQGIQNAKDDVFKEKAEHYEELELEERNRAILRLDLDGDEESTNNEGFNIGSGSLVRR